MIKKQNAASAYTAGGMEMEVLSANPHKLVLMLFDGAIQAINLAKFHWENKRIAEKGKALGKAIAIIDEGLKASLDVKSGGGLAENLYILYDYMCLQLTQANITNDFATMDEVLGLLAEIRGAWAEIGNKSQGEGAVDFVATAQRTPVTYGKV